MNWVELGSCFSCFSDGFSQTKTMEIGVLRHPFSEMLVVISIS